MLHDITKLKHEHLLQLSLLLVITNKETKENISSRLLDITDSVVTKFFDVHAHDQMKHIEMKMKMKI